jgi:hypothetical protein
MNHLVKLMLAVVVGIVAAGINWIYLASQATPSTFVACKEDIKRGEPITLDLLTPVGVPGDLAELRKSLIPFDERQILDGQLATRDYRTGDVIFHRDLAAPEITSQYEEIGPYRLISVGNRFATSVKSDDSGSGSSSDDTITIAVPWPYDAQTRRLMDVTRAQRARDTKEAPTVKIDRVLVFPATGQETSAPEGSDISLGLKPNERAAFISLDGIDNVPRVLQVGQRIGFVILNEAPIIKPDAETTSSATTTEAGME